ncbi:MAG: hypothetical protein KF688_15645 [Pirellulales bacterium]|nr:hypothetical protein [Pirellulales bacterium]
MSVEEATVWRNMPARVRELLVLAESRLNHLNAFERMWEQLLTAFQRRQFNDDLESAWRRFGTLRVWMRAQDLTNRFAGLHSLESRMRYAWSALDLDFVGQHVSLAASKTEFEERPAFDESTGELRFQGRIVRRLRLTGKRTNIGRIARAFQNAGFPRAIKFPLGSNSELTAVTYAVSQLNQGLESIRFRSRENGAVVYWEPR